ncbi:MAG: DNA recombination protein RmuC [Puniceicoccales bacterium]|jgi:DNA recombination protein RmuC|nr:DNA recombination protein RmuC [Puniceicoccales bacterium]
MNTPIALILGLMWIISVGIVWVYFYGREKRKYWEWQQSDHRRQEQYHALQQERDQWLERYSKASGQTEVYEQQLREAQEHRVRQEEQLCSLTEQNASLTAYRQEEEQRREHFKLEMAQLAQNILETKKQSFSQETQKEVGGLIQQLKQDFEHFHQTIFDPERESRIKLSTCFEQLVKQAESMQNSTESLAKALRGDSKIQGDWGETQLENLLEEAGLREENGDYIRQGIGLQLQLEDQGNAKPDFLFRLPRNQWVLIDAKVSLTAYEHMMHAQNEADYKNFLEQHRLSIRKHIDEIAKYHELKTGLSICPFLLMFIPIESAYATAIASHQQGDGKSLAQYARERNVIPVYPSTLFLTLKLIQLLWQIERQNKNAQEIAERGGKLHKKFLDLLESFSEVHKLFSKLQHQFHSEIKKIEGPGGLLVDCKKLEDLGIKYQKSLPENFCLSDEIGKEK